MKLAQWILIMTYEDNEIRDRDFTTVSGETTQVKMMYSDEHTYLENDFCTGCHMSVITCPAIDFGECAFVNECEVGLQEGSPSVGWKRSGLWNMYRELEKVL